MPKLRTLLIPILLAPATIVFANEPALSGAAAIADALLWGKEMPASALTPDLPRNVQVQLSEYLDR